MKEESEKADLKLNIQKIKIMAPGPVMSRQTKGGGNGSSGRLDSTHACNALSLECFRNP